ncbi:MAG: hypothetical protein IPG09_18520 [Ignavibacteria bacterium]|nr:hypothetical protein [Ignavibacteria bacterium]
MEVYSAWINEPSRVSHNRIGRKILRKISVQIGINLLIVTGIFISFGFLHENISSILQKYLGGIEVTKSSVMDRRNHNELSFSNSYLEKNAGSGNGSC